MNELKKWFKCAGVRAIKTVCQTAISLFTVGQAFTDIDWKMVVSISLVSGIYSILTSVAGLPEMEEK